MSDYEGNVLVTFLWSKLVTVCVQITSTYVKISIISANKKLFSRECIVQILVEQTCDNVCLNHMFTHLKGITDLRKKAGLLISISLY